MRLNFWPIEMSVVNILRREISTEHVVPDTRNLGNVARELCEKALQDAKGRLHPLLQDLELDRLSQRSEFVQAFKSALELGIARKFANWQLGVQAVFRFDEARLEDIESWDSSIHLLVKVSRLSNTISFLGKALDKNLVRQLKQLHWSRFRTCQSLLDIQQVTLHELRHGIGYAAMFHAVYTAPIKIWPQDQRGKKESLPKNTGSKD